MTETTDTAETCERCANRDPRDRRDHGHVPADETTETVPPLAKSITAQLTDLAAHACAHGQQEGRTGIDDKEMPACLASHIDSLVGVLFDLAKPELAGSTIATTVEVPLEDAGDLPDGLVEALQEKLGEFLETLGKKL